MGVHLVVVDGSGLAHLAHLRSVNASSYGHCSLKITRAKKGSDVERYKPVRCGPLWQDLDYLFWLVSMLLTKD